MAVGTVLRNSFGSMRHRITVQSLVETIDAARQPLHSYTDKYTNEPASFEQVSGGETNRGRQVEAGVVAVFVVNYRDGYSTTDRVIFDGTTYSIVRVEHPEGIKRFTLLHCKAGPVD